MTHPIQENPIIRAGDVNAMKADKITQADVMADLHPGLPQEELDNLGEAERLGLVVGAAYGQALAERDEARAHVAHLQARLGQAQELLGRAVDAWPDTTWAHDSLALESLVQGIESLWPVGSEQTPTQED